MDVALYEIKYYNKTYNFLQIIVMIIINYHYGIYKYIYFACTNSVSEVYKYSFAQTVFCVKLV